MNIFEQIKDELERKRAEIRAKNCLQFIAVQADVCSQGKEVGLFPVVEAMEKFEKLKAQGAFDDLNRPKSKELRDFMGEVA